MMDKKSREHKNLIRKKWLSNPTVHKKMLIYGRKWKRSWYLKNREKEIKRCSKWNKLHPEKVALNMKKSRLRRPRHYKKYAKMWRLKNKEKTFIYDNKKRMKRLKILRYLKLKPHEVFIIKTMFNGRCFYCMKYVKNMTIDHVIPVSKGGTNEIKNLLPACRTCNSKKRAKDFCVFYKESQFDRSRNIKKNPY